MIDLKNCEAQEILSQFSFAINNLTFKSNKTAEEYKDSKLMEDLDLCWIRILANPSYHFDLRNQAAAQVSRQLAEIPFVKSKMEAVNNPKMQNVAEKMAREHRTLQSFSKLVFYHFLLTRDRHETQILTDIMGEDFYRLPLI